MPVTLYVAMSSLALGLGALGWLLFSGADPVRRNTLVNLTRGGWQTTGDVPRRAQGHLPFGRLIDSPVRRGRLEMQLAKAGFPGGWTVDQVLSVKVLATLVVGIIFVFMWTGNPSAPFLLFGAALTVGVFFLPDLLLYNTAIKRRQQVDLTLPDTLDQMSIAVQAGLGFDSAMLRVARNGKGVLAQELIRTMQDVQVGQTRRNAYEDLAKRTGSVPLRRFTRTIIQAEAYGIPLADVLTSQADEMRLLRRQNAERKAMEIPVKVVFPLILCILPVIFIVILGPAVIQIMDALFGVM